MRRCAVLLAAACSAGVGSAQPAPASPPAASASPAARAGLDVAWRADGSIVIGSPRGQLGAERADALVARGFVFGTHDGWVTGWDPATGEVWADLGPPADDHVPAGTLAISGDGRTLAIGGEASVRIVRAPFGMVEQAVDQCAAALALSHDGKLLACSTTTPVVWDLAARKQLGRAAGPKRGTRAAAFTADGRALVYATDTEIYRWTLDAAAPMLVYRAAQRFQEVEFAENAEVAYVEWLDKRAFTSSAKLVAVATGVAVDLPAGGPGAISPSATRVAIAEVGQLRVFDAVTRALLWSVKTTEPVMPLAFASDDAVAYVEGTHVRFATLPGAPVAYPAPARFAGWLSDDAVAITRGGAVVRLSLVDRKAAPAAGAPISARPPPGPHLEITGTAARLLDGARELGRFPVEAPRINRKDMAYAIAAGAASGPHVVLLSHGPRPDGAADPQCVAVGIETCVHDWTVTLWQVGKTGLPVWRAAAPAPLTSAIAFDHAGKRVLIGTETGDVLVLAMPTGAATMLHAQHHRITRIEVSPGDERVFSEDSSGVQLISRLPAG